MCAHIYREMKRIFNETQKKATERAVFAIPKPTAIATKL